MLQLFKYSGPIQLLLLTLVAFALKFSLVLTDAPLLIEDLHFLVLADKISKGSLLYRDFIDDIPPLSALFFCTISFLFGKSIVAFRIIAIILVFIQALLFNYICNANQLMSEKGDRAAFIYLVCSMICYDFNVLSPAMISITFLLIAFGQVFKLIKSENQDQEVFATGFFISLSYLSLPLSIIFVPIILISFLLFTRLKLRLYVLFLIGFIFPILCLVTYFYYQNGLKQLFDYFIFNLNFTRIASFKVDWQLAMYILLPSAFLVAVGVILMFSKNRFINYQVICHQLLLSWMLLLVTVLMIQASSSNFIIILPFIAFFITQFVIITDRKLLANVLVFCFLIHNIFAVYPYLNISRYPSKLLNFNQQLLNKTTNYPFKNTKLVVLGDQNINLYLNNIFCTPFYNWDLSKDILTDTEHYSSVEKIAIGFLYDLPEVIIDENQVMPSIFSRIPSLKQKYIASKEFDRVYFLRKVSIKI